MGNEARQTVSQADAVFQYAANISKTAEFHEIMQKFLFDGEPLIDVRSGLLGGVATAYQRIRDIQDAGTEEGLIGVTIGSSIRDGNNIWRRMLEEWDRDADPYGLDLLERFAQATSERRQKAIESPRARGYVGQMLLLYGEGWQKGYQLTTDYYRGLVQPQGVQRNG